MYTVIEDIAKNCPEVHPMHWSVEASTLGMRPGELPPASIQTDLGNEHPFLFESADVDRENEVTGWNYRQPESGLTLLVIND